MEYWNWMTVQLWAAAMLGFAFFLLVRMALATVAKGDTRKTPRSKTANNAIAGALTLAVVTAGVHWNMTQEAEAWQYESVVNNSKGDPLTRAALRAAMADGRLSNDEYHRIDSDDADRTKRAVEKLARQEALEASGLSKGARP